MATLLGSGLRSILPVTARFNIVISVLILTHFSFSVLPKRQVLILRLILSTKNEEENVERNIHP
jgi:hypothetical protein